MFFVNEFLIWVISYFFVNGFLIWLLLSPNQNGTLSALWCSSLNWKMDLIYGFGIWVLKKLLAFSLKSYLLSFFFFFCLVAEKIVKENFYLFVCCLYDVIMLTHMPHLESMVVHRLHASILNCITGISLSLCVFNLWSAVYCYYWRVKS